MILEKGGCTGWTIREENVWKECARSFGELADIYYRMPCRKEGFGRQDIEDIFEELTGTVCRGCRSFGKCWKDQAAGTYQQLYEALTAMGEGKTEGDIRAGMSDACIRAGKMAGSMVWAFRNMRMKLYYANRLLEGREAVADQLWEMARLLDDMAEEMQRTGELKEPVNRRLCRLFDRRGAQVRKIFLMHKRKRRDELYITMHARKGECVPIRDLAGILSVVLHRRMVPARNSRTVLGAEDETVLFVEETRYCLLYGISRVPKEGELLSGDSFSYFQNDQGAAVLSLSDGMGSGREAAAESRKLIELLEQFLEAGVSEETALGLINSASVYERKAAPLWTSAPWICTAATVTFASWGRHPRFCGGTDRWRSCRASAPRRDFFTIWIPRPRASGWGTGTPSFW